MTAAGELVTERSVGSDSVVTWAREAQAQRLLDIGDAVYGMGLRVE